MATRKFEKRYIGSAKQVREMDIVRVSLKIADIQEYIVEHEGEQYLHFEVAKRKEPSQHGKTHNVYVSVAMGDQH